MATNSQLQAFDNAFAQDVKNVNAAHAGAWKQELNELLQLSGQIARSGEPSVTSTSTYAQLIALVQRASAQNLSEAQLKERIQALGATAISIAKNVKGLAALFA